MKIGCNNYDYAYAKRLGYDCYDYQGLTDTKGVLYSLPENDFCRTLTEERKKANDIGITFSQVHAPWPTDDKTEESRAKKYRDMQRAVIGTACLGSPYLVVHPVMPDWGKEDDPNETEALNEELFVPLCRFAEDYGVAICIENMPFTALRLSRPDRIVSFVRRLDLPNFFICLDTGHCNVFREEAISAGNSVLLCGDLLKVLHVHDNDGYRDIHLLPYAGSIDWKGFTDALKTIGYSGVFSLECAPSKHLPDTLRPAWDAALCQLTRYLADESTR